MKANALPYYRKPDDGIWTFTRPAAYMLKAKVLVYWASPLFNGNTDYNSFLNDAGEPFFNQFMMKHVGQLLRRHARKRSMPVKLPVSACISNRIISPKVLSDQTMLVNTLRSAVSERWNRELVWGNSSYPVNSGLQSPCFPRSGTGNQFVDFGTNERSVLYTVDLFYSKNGCLLRKIKGYDYAHRFDIRTGDEEHKYYIQKEVQRNEF